MKQALKALLPPTWARAIQSVRQRARRHWAPADRTRRLTPVSRAFGLDRGTPVDRYYIESFLAACAADIRGRVLEVADARYTRQFGGPRVAGSDVLHAAEGNPRATIVGDLATGQGVPAGAFDCMILTQTLQFIYDLRGAIRTVHRALRPGGVVLATFSGISRLSRYDMDRWGEFWRCTSLCVRRQFVEEFGDARVAVRAWGNLATAVAFLQGLAAEELSEEELACHDPDFEVVITVRAAKAGPGKELPPCGT